MVIGSTNAEQSVFGDVGDSYAVHLLSILAQCVNAQFSKPLFCVQVCTFFVFET